MLARNKFLYSFLRPALRAGYDTPGTGLTLPTGEAAVVTARRLERGDRDRLGVLNQVGTEWPAGEADASAGS